MRRFPQFKQLKRLLMYSGRHILAYCFGILGVSSQSLIFNVISAIALSNLTTAAISKNESKLIESLVWLAFYLIGLTMVMPIFTYLFDSSIRRITGRIRKSLYSKILTLNMHSFEDNHSADMLSRINNDVNVAENAYGWNFALLLMSVIAGIGSTIILFMIDIRLAVAALLIGISNLLVNGLLAKPIKKFSDTIQIKLSDAYQRLSDILAGAPVSKIYALNSILFKKYVEASFGIYTFGIKRAYRQSILNSLNWFLIMMNLFGILTLGGIFVVLGDLEFASLVMAVQMLNGILWMFSSVGSFYVQMQAALAGAERVFEIMDKEAETEIKGFNTFDALEPIKTISEAPILDLNDVHFSYGTEASVISGLNLSVYKNQKVALVGSSGSGKSTVFKLLLGFYAPEKGKINFYGRSIEDIEKCELRSLTAYVAQDSFLFEGTIKDNIQYGNIKAGEKEIIDAAKSAYAHDFITALPNGYDTQVGERGKELSGGERQRIAIARAILKNAPILLLDEATASLDSESEQQVQSALEVLMQGRTSLIIAHRLATIKSADTIIVIEDGKIAEQGSHNMLIENGGSYASLYSMQFV